jgi:hypothetical protein
MYIMKIISAGNANLTPIPLLKEKENSLIIGFQKPEFHAPIARLKKGSGKSLFSKRCGALMARRMGYIVIGV